MNSTHLIIIGIWSFLIASIILLYLYGEEISFFGYIVFLFSGFFLSTIAVLLPIKE